LDALTVRVQNERLQAENYNKALQSGFQDLAGNRFELRCTKLTSSPKDGAEKAISKWVNALEQCTGIYSALQDKANNCLVQKYFEEQEAETVKTANEFVRKYEENFFTRQQLKKFFEIVGNGNNPKHATDNFIRRNKIRFYKSKQIARYISTMKNAIECFCHR
jgi:hypothetical protein